MTKLSVTKLFEFEAAHFLPEYSGPCAVMHGHSYKLEVEVAVHMADYVDSNETMIVDFGKLSKIVRKAVVDRLDHSTLNTNGYLHGTSCAESPTAENLVEWIVTKLLLSLQPHSKLPSLRLARVRLWETSSSFAEWRID